MNYDKKISLEPTDGSGSPNESLLHKMESKGCNPQSNCRDGFCGACRVKVLSGQVEHFKDPLGYHDYDNGERLACISRIISNNAEIEFGS